ncbi:4'-phosphopantetheinyl transferase family protein [Fodinibius sp. Rm-B-1B1-1]|uniref:4'-phosphopantetheinyl transferase family protein n=1 Tax=Fodinibius alkaliphilus TaxID=3140241 RepID=UPI00315B1180
MSKPLSEIIDPLPFEGTFSLSRIGSVSAEAISQLGDSEKAELEECSNLKRQQEFVSSRVALKKMAKEMGEQQQFEILKDELGQPYGRSSSQIYFVSIAHTNDSIFCGLTQADPIGVDLEPVDRTVPERLEQRITHPKEKELITKMPAIQLWTIKEAYIKLRGKGLRMNMNEVQIGKESSRLFAELNDDKSAKICSFRLKNKWLAIAYYQK